MITKTNKPAEPVDFDAGVSVLIDKPLYWSSFKVIHELRKAARVKKAGHAGTLDPRATGLLIVCTGKSTKQLSQFMDLSKTYTGTFTLGKITPSMDSETEVSEERDYTFVTPQMLNDARDKFLGVIHQVPPMYSAVSIGGKKLYHLARKGREVHREPREVTIHSFQITRVALPEVDFAITCSKGTYIRVIAADFGAILGCGGYLTSLRRTAIGDLQVADAFTMDEFRSLTAGLRSL